MAVSSDDEEVTVGTREQRRMQKTEQADSERRGASVLRLVDRLFLLFLAIASIIALTRLAERPAIHWALLAYLLMAILVLLLTRPGPGGVRRAIREVYPLLLLVPIYSSLDLMNGVGQVPVHDAMVRGWEQAIFGSQISETWWRTSGTRSWSAIFHAAYLSYYLIVPFPLIWFALRSDMPNLRRSVLIIFTTFLTCYLCFLLFPVAGPYYEFPRPAAWFVDNGPARLVYATLATGSSYGAAFPSSHVAGTVAAALAGWMGSRRLGILLMVPTVLLMVGVVYCQMHYAVDAATGALVGGLVVLVLRGRSVTDPTNGL